MNKKLFRKGENHRAPGWYLNSGEIELFLTEEGGHHAPVTFKAGKGIPIQPYFISPWQDARPDLSHIPLLQNLRGDFFCLPFGGNPEPVDGEKHPPHGETSASKWTMTAAEQKGDVTFFEFEMETKIRPAKVVKRFEMRKGQPVLYVTHTVSGMDGKMPYGHHAILSMPEAGETMYFSAGKFDYGLTPPNVFADPANLEYQYMASGAEFNSLKAVPTRFKDEPTHDYTVYPSPVGYVDLLAVFKKPGKKPAWAVASYPDRGYLFFSLKNAAELPATTLWVSNSGRYAPPWNGNTRCFAIEETCSCFADGLKTSIGKNALTRKGWKTCGEFSKKNPTVIHHIQGVARIPAGYGKTKSATFSDGAVTFMDKKGNSVTVAVDWKFLMD